MSERDQIRQRKMDELRAQLDATGADGEGEARSAGHSEPVHVESIEQFEELVAGGETVLVDFYADWCGPCKMLEPIVADVAAETDAVVAKVDVDAHQQLAQQYNVRGVPTMYLFAGGEPVEQMVGVRQKEQLVSLIGQYA
ncbi:thioredoxin [Halogranum gelatinilyticum]|uniref:Thioredoxin n=1 Tax=Halogranum gelatinilyticum TaxID=660521 RepID=A0A1G9YYF0_9EURY|nr:thioredoxin [Halogranum gelatinilyticum]SDN13735.1 thioredoxin [Halogranum gelatinilyticum]